MNPIFEVRRDEALRLLAAKDVPGWQTVPWTYRFLWWLGVKLRPPHFASWEASFFFHGGRVGVGAACLYFVITWMTGNSELAFIKAAVVLGAGGIMPGFVLAARYQSQAEEHELPHWDELEATADVFD